MPFYIFQKLEIGDLNTIRMCLQLADMTLRYPKRIIVDILVNVGSLTCRLISLYLMMVMFQIMIMNMHVLLVISSWLRLILLLMLKMEKLSLQC